MQVTSSPAHDWQPDWSPDGRLIVFRSERDGGGLFLVPALGGHVRRLSSFGYKPRWSPDSSSVLFQSAFLRTLREGVYVVGLEGGLPKRVLGVRDLQGHFDAAAWHPDGARISFVAGSPHAFFTQPLSGGEAVESDGSRAALTDVLKPAPQSDWCYDFAWDSLGRHLFFEAASRGVRNLWRVTVEPETLRWVGAPERLTTGPGPDSEMALSSDGRKLAFATRAQKTRMWVFPFDAKTGRVAGDGRAVTSAGVEVAGGVPSPDGTEVAFTVWRAGRQELRRISLGAGRETTLADDDFVRFQLCWSPDGAQLAYRRGDPRTDQTSIALMPSSGGEERILISPQPNDTRSNPSDWSPDTSTVLASTRHQDGSRTELNLFPVSAAPMAETEKRLVASAPNNLLYQARFSPDGRWIAFLAIDTTATAGTPIYVVSSSGGEWRNVTSGEHRDDKPRWSPDGRTIYFISTRTGVVEVWGIRFDPEEGRPVGEPFQVTELGISSLLAGIETGTFQLSVTANQLMIPVTEVTGNIWMLENVDQ